MSETKPITPEDLERLDDRCGWCGAILAFVPGIRARMAELEAQLQRAMDLVRFARHYLSDENLISQEEYGALIVDSENGQRVARLESYDDMRRTITQQAGRIAELESMVRGLSPAGSLLLKEKP